MKRIILGITGSIAAYKACDIIRKLKKEKIDVVCILTREGKEFITPLTLRTLSENPVYMDLFFESKNFSSKIEHVELSKNTDLIVIAPATANIIGKIANGIADDLLSATVMATDKKVIFVPAMNKNMWNNKIVQENVSKLKKYGYVFIGPKKGDLACGEYGDGHIEDTDKIVNSIKTFLEKKNTLKNKTILITSGPTREKIDDIRFISNKSSGKTGFFLANEAKRRGGKVIFITGPTKFIPEVDILKTVESSDDMLKEVKTYYKYADIIIGCAAVGDFKPIERLKGKIERKKRITLELEPTKDILKEISKNKEKKIIIGFSAEYSNDLKRAKEKLKEKNLDFIVFNNVSKNGIGFGSDYNEIKIIDKKGNIVLKKKDTKENLANDIFNVIEKEI